MLALVQRVKLHIFLEGRKILQNLHHRFFLWSVSQINGGGFAKLKVKELIQILIAYNNYNAPSEIISTHYATASSSFFAVKSSAQLVFFHKIIALSLPE